MNAEELYQARAKRIRDVIALKVPDRVPVTATFDFFSARYCGYTQEQLMYDPDVLWDVPLRTTMEFEPDLARNPFPGMLLGRLLDVLDYRQMRWPGRQLAAHLPFQFVEGEYMSAEEYDHFLSEPTDFMVRKYWPRIAGSLKGLGKIALFKHFLEYMDLGVFAMLAEAEVQDALDALVKATREAERIAVYGRLFGKKLKEEGFPSLGGGKSYAPFGMIGGCRGIPWPSSPTPFPQVLFLDRANREKASLRVIRLPVMLFETRGDERQGQDDFLTFVGAVAQDLQHQMVGSSSGEVLLLLESDLLQKRSHFLEMLGIENPFASFVSQKTGIFHKGTAEFLHLLALRPLAELSFHLDQSLFKPGKALYGLHIQKGAAIGKNGPAAVDPVPFRIQIFHLALFAVPMEQG